VGIDGWQGLAVRFQRIAAARADAVLLCGVLDRRSHQLVRDKVRALGPNQGPVQLLASDGFLTGAPLAPAAEGMVVVAPGLRFPHWPPPATQVVEALAGRLEVDPTLVEPYAVHAAAAIELLLEAIAGGATSRAAIVRRLFDGEARDGLLGTYTVLSSGDVATRDGAVTGFSVFRVSAAGLPVLDGGVVPPPELVAAAARTASG
jgi:ABC-type branched-subunit amino acid transport system substrate-binding protein